MTDNLIFEKTNTIKCCKDCVPPKRHLGCHSHCEEYLDEKLNYEQFKNDILKIKYSENAIIDSEVNRAYKYHKRHKKGLYRHK